MVSAVKSQPARSIAPQSRVDDVNAAPAQTPATAPASTEAALSVEKTPATVETVAGARARFANQGSAQQAALLRSVDARPVDVNAKYAGAPSTEDVRAGRATFGRNDGGSQITDVQRRLNASGANPGLAEDGKFGPRTERAVQDFQRTHGLPTTGRVDSATLEALERPQTPTQPGNTAPVDATNLPRTGNAFMDSIAADAIRTQRETGVPASVTMAQAMLESGSGRSGLTRQANNYFGIKGEGPAGHVTMPTREVINGQNVMVNANFRAYHNAQESFTDHANLLAHGRRYQTAMQHTDDGERFAREVARAGYATDPRYADSLVNIMRRYDLSRFDQIGREAQ